MQIYFTGLKIEFIEDFLLNFPKKDYKVWIKREAKTQMPARVSKNVTFIPNLAAVESNLDLLVYDPASGNIEEELNRALKLGIPVYSLPEFIFSLSKEKTRVVIQASTSKNSIFDLLFHVLNYHEREVDYFLNGGNENFKNNIKLTPENDFIIVETSEESLTSFETFQPNIALLTGSNNPIETTSSEDDIDKHINAVVKGGILVYNAEDLLLKKKVEESTHTIRRHPYITPAHEIKNGETYLITPEGDMPLPLSKPEDLLHLAGIKWLCQHLGIDEDDFYEALLSYSSISEKT